MKAKRVRMPSRAILLIAFSLAGPGAVAQTSFPWEHRAQPKMAARSLEGQLIARVGLKFWLATSSKAEKEVWVSTVSGAAQSCLDEATLEYGLRVVLVREGILLVPEETLLRFAVNRVHFTLSGLKRGPFRSVEAPRLNVFVMEDVGFSGHRYLGGTVAVDAEHDDAGNVIAFRGARDIQLATSAEGDVLAHEILHAWGGLVDRHSDVTNLMDDEMLGCKLTPDQVRIAIGHSRGGPGEVAR